MTIDKTINEVKELQEKDSLTLNEIDNNVKKILKFGTGGAVDLTEVITEIDNNATKLSTIETNICSIDVKLDENSTKTTEIGDKIDELSTNLSEITTKSNTINEKVENIDSNVETIITQTENLTTMNNNITTINSNTATTNNNVLTIKTDVQDLKTAMANTYFNNKIEQSLDKIINFINIQENKNVFQTDPYALDLPYSEKLTTNRNPTNEDFYSIDEEFTSTSENAFFIALIYCAGTTMNAKFTMSFTCSESVTLKFMITNKSYQTQEFEAGTHSYTLELSDLSVSNNSSVFHFRNTGDIVVHNIQLELSGEQVLFLNRQRKYHLSYSPNKIVINKFENFKGYHLILDNIESLTPDIINKPFDLAAEKVISYGMNYLMYSIQGKYVPYGELRSWVNLSHTFGINYNNGYYTYAGKTHNPIVYSNMGYFMEKYVREGTIVATHNGTSSCGSIMAQINNTVFGELTNSTGYISCVLACDLNRFDLTKRTLFVLEDYTGYNYLQTKAGTRFNVGFGKNATAFLDAENEKNIRIYLNDNGYCVRSEYLINEDNSDIELLSRKIIGTYDFYFETAFDIYFVVKDNELLMFKKNI